MAEKMESASDEVVASKPPDHLRTLHERDQAKRLIVVLENASLEEVKVAEMTISLNYRPLTMQYYFEVVILM